MDLGDGEEWFMLGLLFAKSVVNELVNFTPLEASLVDGFLALLPCEIALVTIKHLKDYLALPLGLLFLILVAPLCLGREDSDSAPSLRLLLIQKYFCRCFLCNNLWSDVLVF